MNKVCVNEKCNMRNIKMFKGVYCGECGDKLVEPQKCRHCKTELSGFNNFCTECGKPNK